ncbi:hypothetical protein GCM10009596_23560 [Arthrobacter rhombi]|uniref:hypothetical protein n=1 Tax=Arthrobacter rhombi TaxID=71253 RepID=UPI0031DC8BD2
MPTITLTGYERRITEFTAERQIPMSRSKTQRLALKLHKRQARMLDEDLTRYITYSDPVGESVATNVDAGRTSLRHSNKKNGPGTVAKQFSETVQPAL